MSRRTHPGRALAAVAGLVLLACPVHAGRFSLALPWYLEKAQGGARDMAVGDFDGDGRDDIAYLSMWLEGPQSISVAWQQPDGSLSALEAIDASSVDPHHLHAADIDGDGVEELLVGRRQGLSVYDLRPGARSIRHVPAAAACRFLASGDVDLDGATDVYCQGRHGFATLFMGRAGVGLVSSRAMEVPGIVGQVVIADVTGDALPDVVLAGLGHNALYVLPGDGTGGFEPAVTYPLPGDNIKGTPSAAVADLDGDGANDVVVAEEDNAPRAALLVMRRGADGYLRFTDTLPAMDMPTSVIAEDMDGDGHPELIVGHSGWYTVSRYIGQAAGPWPTPFFTGVRVEDSVSSLAVGDADSDGQRDVVVGNSIGPAVLYGGREQRTDLDEDLVSDLAWHHASGHGTAWLAADPTLAVPMPTLPPAWMPMAIGRSRWNDGTEFLYRNQVTGTNLSWAYYYDEAQPYYGAAASWLLVGAGDFVGDGKADLLWRNRKTGQNVLWLDGELSDPRKLTRVADQRWTVAGIGDFDADGRADVLWRHAVSGANVLWPGADRAQQRRLPGASVDWAVAGIGDFDRDGRDDIVWRNAITGRNAAWRGANHSLAMPIRGVTDTAWRIAAVGDYNGDGYSDLAWRHAADGRNAIWLSADAKRQMPVRRVRDTGWRILP